MKNLKINLLSLATVAVFFSCSQNGTETLDPNQEPTESAKSVTVQTVIEGVKTHVKSDGSFNNPTNPESSITFDFGFDFVYPTTLTYNNGTEVVVNNITELAKVASTITTSNFIDGIAFPFTIKKNDNTNETISFETDFEATINSYDTDNDGIPNYTDTDDDNNGALDIKEDANQDGDATNDDADNDGIANYQDTDSDNDGQLDQDEDNDRDGDFTNDDSDNDGIPDYNDTDSDNDGINDGDDNGDDNDGNDDNHNGDDDDNGSGNDDGSGNSDSDNGNGDSDNDNDNDGNDDDNGSGNDDGSGNSDNDNGNGGSDNDGTGNK